jgi:hypothetical protein
LVTEAATLLLLHPMMETRSELGVDGQSMTPTSPHSPQTLTMTNSSTMDAIVTCSSTATDDMLDSVDDCVGCVNQIALQHDFEDSLRDVPLQQQPLGLSMLSCDDDSIDEISNERKEQVRSTLYSNESVTLGKEDEVTQGTEIDLLSWCSGGFQLQQ